MSHAENIPVREELQPRVQSVALAPPRLGALRFGEITLENQIVLDLDFSLPQIHPRPKLSLVHHLYPAGRALVQYLPSVNVARSRARGMCPSVSQLALAYATWDSAR